MPGKSTPLLKASSFTSQTLDRFYPEDGADLPGVSMQLAKLQHIRFSPGCLSIWTGQNGHGKSLMLNQFALDVIQSGEKVAIASFEMSAGRTLQRLVRQATGQFKPEMDEVVRCLDWLGKSLWIYDHLGSVNHKNVLEAFSRGQDEHGISHMVIDSLLKCGLGEDDYSGQKRLVDDLQNFAQKRGAHVHLVTHSRKLSSDQDRPGKCDVRGSAGITDLSDIVLSVWRNREKEEARETHVPVKCPFDAILNVAKHRDMGGDAEGPYGLYYHAPSMQFGDAERMEPYIYWRPA